jgi:transposase-like protein
LFDHARTPLTVWFELCWRFATSKQGVSAREAMRDLGIGSYRTAWGMCQRLRRVLVRPGRERLSGVVEVDETFVGGVEPGLAGGRARGKKSLVAVAVETPGRPRLGRARLQVVSDASAETLGRFVRDHVEPGSVVVTDAWSGYTGQALAGYSHRVVNQSQALRDGAAHDGLPPAAHRVAALLKRWLLATHQGSASAGRLQDYLDEWVFRFNRRRSRHRGLVFYRVIQLAVGHEPVRYRQLIHEPRDPDDEPGGYPRGRGGRPESIKPQVKGYPWRSQRD